MANGGGVSRGDRDRNARLSRLRAAVPIANAVVTRSSNLRPTTGLGGWTGLGMDLTAGAGRGSMGTWQTVPACWGLG